jgi:Flp pilus assembly pilin Flp
MVSRRPPVPHEGDALTRLIGALARMLESASCRARREDGQTLVEYALILMFIVIVSVVFLEIIGETASTLLSRVHAGLF